MSELIFSEGITQKRVKTERLEMAYLVAGEAGATPIVLLHGNISSGWFFEDLMLDLVAKGPYQVYAPDLRGYGHSEALPVDARLGVRDFSDDLDSFVQALGLANFHLVGWSMGGNVAMQYVMDYPGVVRSLVFLATATPFGFGGTKDQYGQLNYPDAAGSGGGGVNPDFLQHMKKGTRVDDDPNSPRSVMSSFFFKPPFKPAPEHEEIFLEGMLATVVGDDNWPGDTTYSPNWPLIAPGDKGVNNSFSPKYLNQAAFANINPKPDILWLRGDSDQVISDNSLFCFGTLGQLGLIPGWPGLEVFPPQPMVSQIRHVLDFYKANGGSYSEVVLKDCGHSPHIEKHAEVSNLLLGFLIKNA
jgi:pimeloyl-ACP methyl ester carboxylesterase